MNLVTQSRYKNTGLLETSSAAALTSREIRKQSRTTK